MSPPSAETSGNGGRLLGLARHPVMLLLAANGASAGLGAISLVLLLRFLEVRDFAVVGVVLGIGTLVSMAVDLRLMDLVARRFFGHGPGGPEGPLAAARAGALIALVQGVVVTLLAILLFAATGHVFVSAEVPHWWVWCAAAFSGFQLAHASLAGIIRFCGAFGWTALLRILVQVVNTGSVAVMLWLTGGLDGYFQALLIVAVVGTLLSIAVAVHVVRDTLGGTLLALPPAGELEAIVTGLRDFGSGGLFSAGWMLTRAGDILVVAAFSSDVVTGIYRIARQVADAATSILDAVPHYFEPTIIAALKQGDDAGYRRHRRRILAIGLAVGLAAELVLVPLLAVAAAHLLPKLAPAVLPIALLLAGAAIRIAVQPWLWASAVAGNAMTRFAALLLAGSLAQLALVAALGIAGLLDAATAAAASWLALAVLFLPYLTRPRSPSHTS